MSKKKTVHFSFDSLETGRSRMRKKGMFVDFLAVKDALKKARIKPLYFFHFV